MLLNDDRVLDNNFQCDNIKKNLTMTLILFALSTLTTFYIYANLPLRGHFRLPNIQQSSSKKGYLVDTPGCRMPKLKILSSEMQKYFQKTTGMYPCKGKKSFLIVAPNATLKLDPSTLMTFHGIKPENANCSYQPIFRRKEDDTYIFGSFAMLKFDVPLGLDAVRITCHEGGGVFHEEYVPLVPIKKEIESRRQISTNITEKPLNVIIVGIDSLSKLNFERHLPKTRQFLRNNLNAIELKGYNKIGENTFPNLLALLTGIQLTTAFKNKYKVKKFDDIPLIWKEFSKRLGHRSLMAEDNPNLSLFNYYYETGFMEQPSDYYLRPFAQAVEDSKWYRHGNRHCFGSKSEMMVFYHNLLDFVWTMDYRPFFAFVFTSRLTHLMFNYAGYCDIPLFNLFSLLETMGIFNDSLLIFMSDHGLRYGSTRKIYEGRYEEHWPVMFLTFPRWFYQKYSDVYYNLQRNQHRLTTPFDVHATLKHLLAIQSGEDVVKTSQWGISLFDEIPTKRTCTDAGISGHFCTCSELYPVSANSSNIRIASMRLVETVNEWLKSENPRCAYLKLESIIHARVSHLTSKATGSTSYEDYLVAVTVNPSKAELEGTIRWSKSDKTFEVLDVSRINEYGNQSACIKDFWLKKFCFCIIKQQGAAY